MDTHAQCFDQRLSQLSDEAGYRKLFLDLIFWEPFIRAVCQRHYLAPSQPIRSGIAGTYPTFLVGEKWVVKFFGQLFSGEQSFRSERELHKLLSRIPELKIPHLYGEGVLFPDESGWKWPYLIFEYIPGVSIGEIYDQIAFDQWISISKEMANFTLRLHSISLPLDSGFDRGWDTYIHFLQQQRASVIENHRKWGSLPSHLIDQIDTYLDPIQDLIEPEASPSLIHSDLTRDHLIGEHLNGEWITRAVIDFGDAMTGSPYYEMAVLHLDLFGCRPPIFREYLRGYGWGDRNLQELSNLLLRTALLHQFDVFQPLFQRAPAVRQVKTLPELACLVYLNQDNHIL